MIAFLIFTILFHLSLNAALGPLLYNLPKSLEAEEESLRKHLEADTHNSSLQGKAQNGDVTIMDAPHTKPGLFAKFFHPEIYSDYATLRRLVPHGLLDVNNMYTASVEENAYFPPSVTSEAPLLWIPRDDGGISRQEVQHTSKVIPITDEGCGLNEKNKLVWDPETSRAPIWDEKIYY